MYEKNSVENTLEVIHDNIGYEQLRQTNPEDMGLIDEFPWCSSVNSP